MSDVEQPHTTLPLTEAHGGACSCGEHDAELPVLDARVIPHAVRHGAIFGALSSLRAGQAFVLIAPHNPLPLLAQIAEREGDAIDVSYLVEGPDDWQLKLTRTR